MNMLLTLNDDTHGEHAPRTKTALPDRSPQWELLPFSLCRLHNGGLHKAAEQIYNIFGILRGDARTARCETEQHIQRSLFGH